jgi:hypothetical protein
MRRLSHASPSPRSGSRRTRASFSVTGAVLLSLLLAGQSMAASWGAVPLSSSGQAYTGGLVTLGTSTAVAVYEDNRAVLVRRSTNSGASWKAPLRLAATSGAPAIAGRGTNVDVVWMKSTSEVSSVIRYARSTNSGGTFRSSVRLSSKAGDA